MTARYRRSPITAAEPKAREQLDREFAKIERSLVFEAQAELDDKADSTHASTHATGGTDELTPADIGAEVAGAAATVQANLNTHIDGAANSHSGIDTHIASTSIHTPVPAKMPTAEAEAGTATTQRTIDAATLAAAIGALGGGGGSSLEVRLGSSSVSFPSTITGFTEVLGDSFTLSESGCLITFAEVSGSADPTDPASFGLFAQLYVNGSARGSSDAVALVEGTTSASTRGSRTMIDAVDVFLGTNTVQVYCTRTSSLGTAVATSGQLLTVFVPGVSVA